MAFPYVRVIVVAAHILNQKSIIFATEIDCYIGGSGSPTDAVA